MHRGCSKEVDVEDSDEDNYFRIKSVIAELNGSWITNILNATRTGLTDSMSAKCRIPNAI